MGREEEDLVSAAKGILLGCGIGLVLIAPFAGMHINDINKLGNKLGEDTGYKSVQVTGFNPIEEEGHYYVTVTGKGSKEVNSGVNSEFVKCMYETDETRFNELVEKIKSESVYNGNLAYSVEVLGNLLDIVNNGKLVAVSTRDDITYSNEGEYGTQILDVSQPKIEGNVAHYYVVSLQEGVNENGEPGYYTVVDKVHFTVTKEIEKDPSIIFTMGKDNAYIETVGRKFSVAQDYTYSIDGNMNTSAYTVETENTNSNSR